MPNLHLTKEQIRALTTFCWAARKTLFLPAINTGHWTTAATFRKGWWVVKKYNCMGCHQLIPGQRTSLMAMAHYQGPDGQELLPPKLLTEGARVDPNGCSIFEKSFSE